MKGTYFRGWELLLPPSAIIRGRAMVVAPHPDDEIVGCGGALVAHRKAGEEVDVVVLTDGGMGNPDGEGGPAYVALRREETMRAVQLAGGAHHHFLDYKDGHLSDSWKPADELQGLLEKLKPTTVFFPSPYEVHPDHRAASLHLLRAVRNLEVKPQLLAYEIGGFMTPNLLLDITPHMLQKEQALTAFPSQLLHQDLVGKVRALNHARSVNVDDPAIRYVEAYLRLEGEAIAEFLECLDRLLGLTEQMRPR